MSYGLNRYRRTNIQTADRKRIIVLLYEGAINNLRNAKTAMRESRRDEQAILINKSLEIVKFLDNALDHEQGGDISQHLAMLYAYIRDILAMANISCEEEKLDEAIGLFNTLLEGWRGAIEQLGDNSSDTQDNETPSPDAQTPRVSMVG